MSARLGEHLVGEERITEEQLQIALEHQRFNGGRLGQTLVNLGMVKEEDVALCFKQVPPPLRSIEDSGLSGPFIGDLILKHAIRMEEFLLTELAGRIMLPVSLLDKAIEELRREHLIEVKGAGTISRLSYKLAITEFGRKRAADLFAVSRYAGPAPVPFREYRRMVELQTVKSAMVSKETIDNAFNHIVLSEQLLGRLGPAVNSGKAIFLYGPSGNGKTTIAEAIGRILPDTIYVPHAVLVGGEIISVYDQVSHRSAEAVSAPDDVDQRWVLVKRPVVMVGGEMTLDSLDLEFNPISKFYEAPLQMKANNGLFIVDDFGRQKVDPQLLLNRWIVPLERRTDFLTLNTGLKFEIPFDQLVIFSTNIEPRKLVDEAFLRRIHYKIKIDYPTLEEYEAIFRHICESNRVEFSKEVFGHLINNFYRKMNVDLNACHPRDLIDHIIDLAHYEGRMPELTGDTIAYAWENYFVDL